VIDSSKASFLGDANFPASSLSDDNFANPSDRLREVTKIKLYQYLYERYTQLMLSHKTDRPIAIKGLETRLLDTLRTRGGHGVLEVYLGRCLLWKRIESLLQRIKFHSKEEKKEEHKPPPPPSWSWMAYDGPIEYMKIPFERVEWNQWSQHIISPWRATSNGSTSSLELRVQVRDISTALPAGPRVYLDDPNRTLGRPYKCVVLGSRQDSTQAIDKKYYVLIVGRLDEEGSVYDRAGAARLEWNQIVWESATEARIR
jgi:hypothetical protein